MSILVNTPHTVAVPEMATQLTNLLQQAKKARHPLSLATAENAEPVAVLMAFDEYQQVQKHTSRFYEWQVGYLNEWLNRVERQWENQILKEECVQAFQENTWLLWELAPKSVRKLLVVLVQSAKMLNAQTFSKEQVAVLRYTLGIARMDALDESLMETVHQKLIESGLSPRLSFDDELVQLYLDEL